MENQRFVVHCNFCENEIPVGTAGLAPGVNLESIRLQSREIGVEVQCDSCNQIFIYHEQDKPVSTPSFLNEYPENTYQDRNYLLP